MDVPDWYDQSISDLINLPFEHTDSYSKFTRLAP